MERSFIVHTPIGKLRVYAKHEVDCAGDYPGVYIDFIKDDTWEHGDMLCCVEYDSYSGMIQTVVYQPREDDPVALIAHEIEEE